MIKLKFNDFFKTKSKNNLLTVQIFLNLQNHPTFHSVNLIEKESALLVFPYYVLVYDYSIHLPSVYRLHILHLCVRWA